MTRARQGEREAELAQLRSRAEEAEQALEAIRKGEVESLIIDGPDGPRIFSLEGASQSYRVLVEAMNEGAATLGEGGVILYCNACFACMLGAPLERVMGSSIHQHVPPRLGAAFEALLRRDLEAGVREEMALTGANGVEVPALVSLSAMVDEGRRILCLIATDLRQQRRSEALVEAEKALREADRRKNDFLAVLSHELRNPLAPIKNSLYILDRVPPGGDQATRARAVIDRQVAQLTRLVDDLLDVTRIARNKVALQLTPLDLDQVVRRTVEDHRSLFEGSRVHLSTAFAAGPVRVKADWARIAQVIGNLLANAAKFTDPGGSVLVSVERDPALGQAVLRVADTGAGMAPDTLERLFEPFAQADRTLDRSKGGLGLGLALVKGIVEMHGGEVSAHSAGPGRGAELVVRLPLDATAELPAGVAPAEARPRRRILVIEDNPDVASSLQEALALQGHQVDVAYDGPCGLRMARELRPEVALCDIGLPGMDGYAVARAFRADAALEGVFLVALTGYALPEDRSRATEAGFDRHVGKPPSIEELEALLGAVGYADPR